MFGFIKKLFGGILGFINGLFSSKKTEENKAIAPKGRNKSGFYMQLEEAAEDIKSAVQGKTPEPTAQAKKPEPAKAAAKVEAKQPEAASVATAIAPKPEPVIANANGKGKPESDPTFAPKYLNPVTSSSSRRRPGPSLNNFMDMARQVKTPGA